MQPPGENIKRRPVISADVAYIAPMAVFLIFAQMGGWFPSLYPLFYLLRTLAVPVLLVILWKHYTPIKWRWWWLGVIVGVVGIVQWIGVESLVWHLWPDYPLRPKPTDAFNPQSYFADWPQWWYYAFIAVRLIGAVLVVPVMEELFWRDYIWRHIAAPSDFRLARVGEFNYGSLLILPLVFAMVHPAWAITSIVWALMIGGLLVVTRSIGACIIAHAITNLLLGIYVLQTGEWLWW